MSHVHSCFLYQLMSGVLCLIFFFKQKTAYEMRISDWSSDVCSSDLTAGSTAATDLAAADRGVGGHGHHCQCRHSVSALRPREAPADVAAGDEIGGAHV